MYSVALGDAGDAGDRGDQFVGQVALAAHARRRGRQIVDALVAAQRSLDAVLAGHVGAQAHRSQHVGRPSM